MAFVFSFFILNYNYINLNNLSGQIEREPPSTPEKQKLARLQGNKDENNPKTTDLQMWERKAGGIASSSNEHQQLAYLIVRSFTVIGCPSRPLDPPQCTVNALSPQRRPCGL